MSTIILTLIGLITAAVHIAAEYSGNRRRIYIFKPMTTCLIIAIAVLSEQPPTPLYYGLIIAGLLFSLAGDVFLMLPSDQFIAGLVSFLLAHLLYIAAFLTDSGFATSWWYIPLLYGIVMYLILSPHIGQLRVPVVIYIVVILVMGWQAAGRWHTVANASSLRGMIGAVLFVISDTTLALNRFRKPFKHARALTMSSYYAAQWLLAMSITMA